MYEKAILGFLRLRPLTTYDLAQAMKESTSFFYSVSLGSIHPALQRLLKAGQVTQEARVDNGRNKKTYSITDAGLAAFDEWVSSPLTVSKVKDDAVLRLFFLGALEKGRRRQVLQDYLHELAAQQEELAAVQEVSEARAAVVDDELKDVAAYQLHTLEFGLDYYAFVSAWIERLLQDDR